MRTKSSTSRLRRATTDLWNLLSHSRRMRPAPTEKLDPASLSCKVRAGYREKFEALAHARDMSRSQLLATLIEELIDSQEAPSQSGLPERPLVHLELAGKAWRKAIRDGRITPAEEHEINRHVHDFKVDGLYPGGRAA